MSLSFPSIWVSGSSFILASCLIGKQAISSILLDQWCRLIQVRLYSAEKKKFDICTLIFIFPGPVLTNSKVITWPLTRTVCAGKNIVDWSLLSTTGYSGMISPVLSKILSEKKKCL